MPSPDVRVEEQHRMTVEVRIPTILRTYTGGEKAVHGARARPSSALIDDLETNHPGLSERLLEDGDLRRFVNVYVNDEDVRFIGGLEAAAGRRRPGRRAARRRRGLSRPTPAPAPEAVLSPPWRPASVARSSSSTARTSTRRSAPPAEPAAAAGGAAALGAGHRLRRDLWDQPVTGLFFLNASNGQLPGVLRAGAAGHGLPPGRAVRRQRREGRRRRHPAHARGASPRTPTPTCCCAATTRTSSSS